jgi:hypothetical protein
MEMSLSGKPTLGAHPCNNAQLSWTHHRIILGQSKRPEEREFYLRMAVKESESSSEDEDAGVKMPTPGQPQTVAI